MKRPTENFTAMQTAIVGASLKNKVIIPLAITSARVEEVLRKLNRFALSHEVAEAGNWDSNKTVVALSYLFQQGRISRKPYAGPGNNKYEYRALPNAKQLPSKSDQKVIPSISIERRYTLHIHDCSVTFTKEELIALKQTILKALGEI